MMEPISLMRIDAIEHTYQQKHCVDGVAFVGYRGSDRLATDDDNALYTGLYLAAASYRAAVNKNASPLSRFREDDLDAVFGALNGLTLLTNVSGTPGVLVRQAFPLAGAWDAIGYDPTLSLEHKGNTFGNRIREGRIYHGHHLNKQYVFLTKTTKDQLSGVLFGLACAKVLVPNAQPHVDAIITDLWHRLDATDYSLVDHMGNTFGTSAHRLDEPLRVCIDALYCSVTGVHKPSSWFFRPFWNWLMTRHYNRIIQNTYTYNLNMIIAHSLTLLRNYHKCQNGVDQWTKTLYNMVKDDGNPHFDLLGKGSLTVHSEEMLNRRIIEPYPKGFCWSRDPNEWFDGSSDYKQGPEIDALLPYWMNQYYGYIGQ